MFFEMVEINIEENQNTITSPGYWIYGGVSHWILNTMTSAGNASGLTLPMISASYMEQQRLSESFIQITYNIIV